MTSLRDLGELLGGLRAETEAKISELLPTSERLQRAAAEIAQSFSGSWLSDYHDLYFGDFSAPPQSSAFSTYALALGGRMPPGWQRRKPEEVKAAIEEKAQAGLDPLEVQATQFVKGLESKREDILDAIHGEAGLSSERSELESFSFDVGRDRAAFVKQRMPREVGTIDQVTQHTRMPAHVAYETNAYDAKLACKRAQAFLRLLRRIERQANALMSKPKDADTIEEHTEHKDLEKARRVFVVLGRDNRVREAMFTFLRSLGLDPVEWGRPFI